MVPRQQSASATQRLIHAGVGCNAERKIHKYINTKLMDNTQTKKFNKRSFITIAMFMSGLMLPFSGLMNHRLQFETLTTARHFWMTVHNVAAILFILFMIIHISYNWRLLIKYSKNVGASIISKEAMAAIFLVIFIVGLFSMHALHG